MTARDEAIRLIGSLPDNCSWEDVLDLVTRRVTRGAPVDAMLARTAAGEGDSGASAKDEIRPDEA